MLHYMYINQKWTNVEKKKKKWIKLHTKKANEDQHQIPL